MTRGDAMGGSHAHDLAGYEGADGMFEMVDAVIGVMCVGGGDAGGGGDGVDNDAVMVLTIATLKPPTCHPRHTSSPIECMLLHASSAAARPTSL